MACAGSDAISVNSGMTLVDCAVNVGPARKAKGSMTNDEYIVEAVNRRFFWWTRSHPVVERQSEILSPTICGSDTACFATKHASRGTRRSTENDGTKSTVDNRSSGGWADFGRARVAVAP